MLELYIYVPKPVERTTILRRAAATSIQEQMPRAAGLLREQGITADLATQHYLAIAQTRLLGEVPLVILVNTSFHRSTRSKQRWTTQCKEDRCLLMLITGLCVSRFRVCQSGRPRCSRTPQLQRHVESRPRYRRRPPRTTWIAIALTAKNNTSSFMS